MQAAIENVHKEVNFLLIDMYLTHDPAEKNRIFNWIASFPCIGWKADWTLQWCGACRHPFAEHVITFAALEGIFFSGAFCAIFWFKGRGLLPGLCFSNELISRDEGLHCDFACLVDYKLLHKAPPAAIRDIIKDAVEIKKEFVANGLPVRLIGMNADHMANLCRVVHRPPSRGPRTAPSLSRGTPLPLDDTHQSPREEQLL